jgi:MoxR-like ATPase
VVDSKKASGAAVPKSYFAAERKTPPSKPVRLSEGAEGDSTVDDPNPGDYIAEQGLVDAVNTALLLHQPLLLTGEPGTGKTQLAAALAHQLGYEEPLRFQAKSTSQARDLFYTYDALGHYRAKEGAQRLDFVLFSALGRAVLRANERGKVQELLPSNSPELERGNDARPSVVLIDEIDKAPRDFPNDILAELEELRFDAPEIGLSIAPLPAFKPVVVITSNSERDLPDAFLRRCIYHDIPFPQRDVLRRILQGRLKSVAGTDKYRDFINAALEKFDLLRSLPGIRKKPATAELIAWIQALRLAYENSPNPLSEPNAVLARLGALVKTRDDFDLAKRALSEPSRR